MTDAEVVEKIKLVLDEINNEIQLHEGNIALLDFKDGLVYLELEGACCGCPASSCGVISDFEQKLKAAVPEIKKIVLI